MSDNCVMYRLEVLLDDDVATRAHVIEHILKIAEHLITTHNYMALRAIYLALVMGGGGGGIVAKTQQHSLVKQNTDRFHRTRKWAACRG
jgi:hypothetical protein